MSEPAARSRNRTSAKRAGSSFETLIAQALSTCLEDAAIHRGHLKGAKDTGDVENAVINEQLVTVSCKNERGLRLGTWWRDVLRLVANHRGSATGIVVHKRHGVTDPLDQWATTTLGDLLVIATGKPRIHFEALIHREDGL